MMNRLFGYGMVVGGYLGLFYINVGCKIRYVSVGAERESLIVK